MKPFLSSLFLCVVFVAGEFALRPATLLTVDAQEGRIDVKQRRIDGYGSRSKNKYGKHSISCDSFSCGPTANQISSAKKVKCGKKGCTFNRCCKVPCPPIYNETCPASVYDNPLTRALCYDKSEEFCEFRPVAHIKSYEIVNNCANEVVLNGQSVDIAKYNCNSPIGCGMPVAPGVTKVFDRQQNIDFFPFGDSTGGSQRLQFAFDADCPAPVNRVWVELNQSPARCPIPNSNLPNSQNEAGSSVNGYSGIEPCSDPDAYVEFGQSYICYDNQKQPQLIDCNAQGAVRHHAPGTPHFNFARQQGFSELNLGVSFENDAGDPYCSGGLLGNPSPVSRAQTQIFVDWCKNPDPDLVRQKSAKLETICSDIEICRPYCPNDDFRRSLLGWSPSIDTNCNACTLQNKLVDGHYESIELNYYAKYLSENSCVWDVKTGKWYQQPPTVTTQANFNAKISSKRKWNPNAFPPPGVASSSGASMFECWDKAGTGSQGIGWGESCEVNQFTRMKVTLCPDVVTCLDTTV